MKNSIHYSKQNTANATRVAAALASLGQKLHTRLQSLCFAPCNVIYYFIAPLLKIRFSVPAKRDETTILNPKGETSKVGSNQIPKTQCGKSFLFIIFSVRYVKKIGHVTLLIYALKCIAEVQYGPNGVLFCRWGSVRADLTKPLLESLVWSASTKALRYQQGPD